MIFVSAFPAICRNKTACNFFYHLFTVIYKQGPRHFHASFLVLVHTSAYISNTHYVGKNLKGAQRVAETSDKDVLILGVNEPKDFDPALPTPAALECLTIDETVIRRFNYTSFVQSKQKQ